MNVQINSPAFFIGREGSDLISFGSGQPDLPPPTEIFEHINRRRLFKYGLIQGEANLRQALAKDYPKASVDDFVITNGASEALDLVFRALYKKFGSVKVLLGQPYYYSYPEIIQASGHQPVYTKLINGRIDVNDLKRKVKSAKVVLINSPSNPTGRVESLSTLHLIEELTHKYGAYIVSDEVYKDLIYVRSNYNVKGKNVITINSFSKTYSMCGLRIGYLYARDSEIVAGVINLKTHTSMNTNVLGQQMAIKALAVPPAYIAKQTNIWLERRDFIYEELRAMGFSLWKPEGAFYVLPRIKNASRVVNDLYYDYKVIVYDGAWFGEPDRIRLSYALDINKIKEGLARIQNYISDKQDWLIS